MKKIDPEQLVQFCALMDEDPTALRVVNRKALLAYRDQIAKLVVGFNDEPALTLRGLHRRINSELVRRSRISRSPEYAV
jgi:hypothetical protein